MENSQLKVKPSGVFGMPERSDISPMKYMGMAKNSSSQIVPGASSAYGTRRRRRCEGAPPGATRFRAKRLRSPISSLLRRLCEGASQPDPSSFGSARNHLLEGLLDLG